MRSFLQTATLLIALAGSAFAHFTLEIPESLGFDDKKETEGPCGSFDITDRKKVTDWPVEGHPIFVKTGHPTTTWFIRGALLNDTDTFVNLGNQVVQKGAGNLCVDSVKAPKEWAGQDGVIQVIQPGHHGNLYQCAAVKFTDGKAAEVPSECKDSPNIQEATTSVALPAETGSHAGGDHSTTGTETGTAAAATSSGSDASTVAAGLGSGFVAAMAALFLA